MKKLLLVLGLLLGGGCFGEIWSNGPVSVTLSIIKEDEASKGNTKAPARPLVITLEENILALPATPVDYTLELLDEMETVVYTAYLPTGTTQVTLPSYLAGEYEIRLVADAYYYIGYVSY